MGTMERFEDIKARKLARELMKETYRVSSRGKCAEDYALRDQMRRTAISILSNLAEGFERSGNKEFVQYLAIAKLSSGDLRDQWYAALDLQ